MSRPAVSVIVPFAGTTDQAHAVLTMLNGLETRPDDELIVADNSGTTPPISLMLAGDRATIRTVRAAGEASAAHARNAGAATVKND